MVLVAELLDSNISKIRNYQLGRYRFRTSA
jgi:hypothetical protein